MLHPAAVRDASAERTSFAWARKTVGGADVDCASMITRCSAVSMMFLRGVCHASASLAAGSLGSDGLLRITTD
jgi:hypothetical protein